MMKMIDQSIIIFFFRLFADVHTKHFIRPVIEDSIWKMKISHFFHDIKIFRKCFYQFVDFCQYMSFRLEKFSHMSPIQVFYYYYSKF